MRGLGESTRMSRLRRFRIDVLSLFHPLIGTWFRRRYGEPTDIQQKAWPVIAGGNHLLMTAPTGSGKTLSAFLWGLNQLITARWSCGGVRMLYVSPLRALNNDIRINLLNPLSELRGVFRDAGAPFPVINVQTRSGDTPSSQRQRMLRHPPEILITTPESLNLILSSLGGRNMIGNGIETVILDEIHAVLSSKRGTHLMTAVERLVPLCGEFQRIALSATVRPMEKVAGFVGGYEVIRGSGDAAYRKRSVSLVQAVDAKQYEVRVCAPPGMDGVRDPDAWWGGLVRELRERIEQNRSTLLFANSRRFTEKLARLINGAGEEEERVAYSHHSSLSREIRHLVEKKLRDGELRALVATSSLELGIDIGKLDEVLLVQAPYSISSALQRVGRAGHGVRERSRSRLYPLFSRDFLHCAVMARAIMDRDIEQIRIPSCPLDVLAQVVLSMTCVESWNAGDLYTSIRAAAPYQDLSRGQFDLVLNMLAGRYEETRIRELKPRISIDPLTGRIRCREGTARVLYMAGGTIPDRGYFHLRVHDSGSKIGELDEEFVWERSIGDVFSFGTQYWRITNIDHQNVEVAPAPGRSGLSRAAMAPFWKADLSGRDFHLSERIGLTLERIEANRDYDALLHLLKKEYYMDDAAAKRLLELIREQTRITGEGLPHRYRIITEHLPGLSDRRDSRQIVVHALWGGRVIAPLCVALAQAWEERYETELTLYHDDDSILIALPDGTGEVEAREILTLVKPDEVERLLRRRLERTGLFGARFRENAARALLLPKSGFDRRTPLWLSRVRAKRLLQSVQGFDDFPIITETWRTCLRDEFDLENLKKLLDEVIQGVIAVKDVHPASPSPLAAEILHWQTHAHMYEDDTPELGGTSRLREDILQEVVYDAGLRPKIPAGIIEDFTAKLKRLTPGYTPESAEEYYDWIRERLLIPLDEAGELESAMARDHAVDPGAMHGLLRERVVVVLLPGGAERAVLALEDLSRLMSALFIPGDEGEDRFCDALAEWLRYEGPVGTKRIRELFGVDEPRMGRVIETLVESGRIVCDFIGEGAETREICDAVNLERLLRLLRSKRREPFTARAASSLPLFMALQQGLDLHGEGVLGGADGGERGEGSAKEAVHRLRSCLEKLFGYPGRAESWESDFLPARIPSYSPELLDLLLQGSNLIWFGAGRERVSFCLSADLELFPSPEIDAEEEDKNAGAGASADMVSEIFPDRGAKYEFRELLRRTGMEPGDLAQKLWDLVWSGAVSNDRFDAVRQGIREGFSAVVTGPAAGVDKSRRLRFSRWQQMEPLSGNWYLLDRNTAPSDLLEEEDITRDRVRQLLARYGVLCREVLQQELPALRWGAIFRTLRIMELSGEVLAGYFFEGVPGLQFASHEAFRTLQRPFPGDAVYWMNGTDPASLCGVKLEGIEQPLPRRLSSNYLVFRNEKLVLVLGRKGREARFYVEPGDSSIQTYLQIYRKLLDSPGKAPTLVRVERINGKSAVESPYREQLLTFGFTRSHRDLVIRRSYR
jgi:ATP-dependent Lhr-like helicase